jgi:hypothetical protein
MKLFIDENAVHCWMRMKIKLSPSGLIGLRSPVVSSTSGSTATNYIICNVLRFNEHCRGIDIQLLNKFFNFDTQISC